MSKKILYIIGFVFCLGFWGFGSNTYSMLRLQALGLNNQSDCYKKNQILKDKREPLGRLKIPDKKLEGYKYPFIFYVHTNIGKNRGHRYTCEEKTESKVESMMQYCKNSSNSISIWLTKESDSINEFIDKTNSSINIWSTKADNIINEIINTKGESDNIEYLSCSNEKYPNKDKDYGCHICVCDVGMVTDRRGWCCSKAILDANGNGECKCPEGYIENTDGNDCIEIGSTDQGGSDGGESGGEDGEESGGEDGEEDEKPLCPPELQDSRGICCEKIYYDLKLEKEACCEGILLNTNVPFIGQCIVYRKKNDPQQPIAGLVVDEYTAFPVLMGALSKIIVSIILLSSFGGLLVGGVMISASGSGTDGINYGKKIIGNAVSGLALLGMAGTILYIINPSFFG